MLPRQLSPADLAAARLAYEQGVTLRPLAEQHGVAEGTLRRMLATVGVTIRPRGLAPRVLPAELIIVDHRGGMTCRAIAAKYGVAGHQEIGALLKAHGVDVLPRRNGKGKGRGGAPLGDLAAKRQRWHRQKPPVCIPCRTAAERLGRRWTAPELQAVALELAAGRVAYAPRGRSGLPERQTVAGAMLVFWRSLRAA